MSTRSMALVFCAALLGAVLVPAGPAGANVKNGNITIGNNSEFTPENGVRYGKGTKADPYVFEGWDLGSLKIHDTDRYIVIRNNIIRNLTLDWVGDRVTVVNNRIGDLRVNQNVKRTGEATSGVIRNNRFDFVGQLRHWDGVFANNVIGHRAEEDSFYFDFGQGSPQVANLDGFNGARYAGNVFYGYVELRIHGHHHSSSFSDDSHYHGEGSRHGKMALTHMERYHSAVFENNKIYATGPYGFIYTDSNHAGNDRTATSETNEALNDPHVHHTKVAVLNNELIGSGIMVDIFNADDQQKHLRTATGRFVIKGNDIKLAEYRETADGWSEPPNGIEVHQARDVRLTIADNTIAGPEVQSTRATTDQVGGHVASGIELWDVEKASIHLMDNFVSNRVAGIYARRFNRVEWWVHGLRTEAVDTKIDYDNSAGSPKTEKQERRHRHEH